MALWSSLARRGRGSLVSSVFTNDPDTARETVLGLGAFHGRVLIGNRVSAKSSVTARLLPVLCMGARVVQAAARKWAVCAV